MRFADAGPGEEGTPPRLPSGAPPDVARLEADFPAWQFGVRWTTAATAADARMLLAWSLEDGATVTAADEQAMRRKLGEAGG